MVKKMLMMTIVVMFAFGIVISMAEEKPVVADKVTTASTEPKTVPLKTALLLKKQSLQWEKSALQLRVKDIEENIKKVDEQIAKIDAKAKEAKKAKEAIIRKDN